MPQPGATLLVVAVLLPVSASAACFLAPRLARGLAVAVALGLASVVVLLAVELVTHGPLEYRVGGWGAPLGIDLRADGLTLFMLLAAASTGLPITVYGLTYFPASATAGGFWPLWLLLWGALNALFLSGDAFNLYVTLELMGLSAVVLVALAGSVDALGGAMRYLLMTLTASLIYLLGVGLLYHQTGVLDLDLLGAADALRGGAAWVALGLMCAALLVKSALFPLHFWLPPAHSSAPVPVSAALSGLVVKATFYLLLRLWLDVMPPGKEDLGTALGVLGAAAIVWGSVQALRQSELKLLVAYSTVAQLGYLFLPFAVEAAHAGVAWRGAAYFVLCHALAKTAMFMTVGNLQKLGGSARLGELRHVARQFPVSLAAFGIAGITIIGLPPSGGFLAKWLLLQASIGAGQWWLAVVVLAGGLLSAAYVFRVVGLAFVEDGSESAPARGSSAAEWITLAVALGTLALGFTAPPMLRVLEVGSPFGEPFGGALLWEPGGAP